jgi:parallel beta-helix repeat protein
MRAPRSPTVSSRTTAGYGINVAQHSSLTASNNIIAYNDEDGVQVSDSRATLTDNLIQHNGQPTGRFGIHVTALSTAVLLDNTVAHSGSDGIRIHNTSQATISGGGSTQNSGDGIRVGGGTDLPGRCTAAIGLDGTALLELSLNAGAGLFVVNDGFGSEARIDSRQIVFSGNAGGATVGNVIDVAPGP